MRAMILAAGLATRLRPLSLVRPKVLVPVMGTPVVDFWLSRLETAGCAGLAVNAHHLSDRLTAALAEREVPYPLEVFVEQPLLGTAGGLRNALDFLGGEPFCAINGDILCTADLSRLHRQHLRSGAAVSMFLRDHPDFNNVAVDGESNVLGFGDRARAISASDPGIKLMAFTGIHFLDGALIEHLPRGEPSEIIPVYNELIERGRPPRALFEPGAFWAEMGSVESYRALNRMVAQTPPGLLAPVCSGELNRIDPAALVAPGCALEGSVVIGAGCRVGEGARIKDTILWDDVTVAPGAAMENCVVADGVEVSGDHAGEVIVPGDARQAAGGAP